MKKNNTSRRSTTKQKINKKKVAKVILIVVAITIASCGIYFGFKTYKQVAEFSADALLNPESSTQISVYDDTAYYSHGGGGVRKNVTYDDIPQVMIDAVVAAEDSRYFEHNGFDVPRIVKALAGNIAAGGITGGGSTITQQIIKKSYYPKEEQTIERKLGEVLLSIKATKEISKEEILELYLNKIYFGYGNKSIGIYAASKYYFDKEVSDLTLPEAALLAGALNSPNNYDPFINLDKAQKRRDKILDLMEYHGYITAAECKATKAIPVENTLKSNPMAAGGAYQAYADKVTREVYEKTELDPNEVPMKIYTYLDKDLQAELDDIASGEKYNFSDGSLEVGASIQNNDGQIVGVISGREYAPMGTTYAYAGDNETSYGQRNQPGSSLKPILSYASAFEFLNYSTAHYVHDIPISAGSHVFKNWNNKYHGDISVTEALQQSWNAAALDTYRTVLDTTKAEGMKSYIEGFGFDMSEDNVEQLGIAIGSWTKGTTPEEVAGAYSVIANGGTYIEPHTVQKIELLQTGEIIDLEEEYTTEKSQALSEESAYMIRDVMTNYVKSGSGKYSYLNLGYNIGAKTGTSNFDSDPQKVPHPALASRARDSWMAAYTADYSWAVWCGYSPKAQKEGKYLKSSNDSALIAQRIAKILGQPKNTYPEQPSGVVKSTCVSGLYPYVSPGDGVPSNRVVSGLFKKENLPSGSAGGSSLNNLAKMTVTKNVDKVSVELTAYDPESRTKGTSKPTKTYTVNGKSYELPYLGDPSQIYGKVVYAVEVQDSSGNVVHTQTGSSNVLALNYTFTEGEYTIFGYYALENGGQTSNRLSQKITVEATAPTEPPVEDPTTPTDPNTGTEGGEDGTNSGSSNLPQINSHFWSSRFIAKLKNIL